MIRLNLGEPVGRESWSLYTLKVVPAFVVFDSNGREVWRQEGQIPDTRRIIEMASSEPIQ